MREKLIELIKQGARGHTLMPTECIADYLIENGVIVPPCKVGETLYLIQIDYIGNYSMSPIIVSSKITMFSILRAYEEKTIIYMSTDKNKAEQKLQALKGGADNGLY